MVHNPCWEADNLIDGQETLQLLWNPKVHYRIHKILPLDPILIQLIPAQNLTTYFLNIHFNIILPYTLSWSLPFSLSAWNAIYISYLRKVLYTPLPPCGSPHPLSLITVCFIELSYHAKFKLIHLRLWWWFCCVVVVANNPRAYSALQRVWLETSPQITKASHVQPVSKFVIL